MRERIFDRARQLDAFFSQAGSRAQRCYTITTTVLMKRDSSLSLLRHAQGSFYRKMMLIRVARRPGIYSFVGRLPEPALSKYYYICRHTIRRFLRAICKRRALTRRRCNVVPCRYIGTERASSLPRRHCCAARQDAAAEKRYAKGKQRNKIALQVVWCRCGAGLLIYRFYIGL